MPANRQYAYRMQHIDNVDKYYTFITLQRKQCTEYMWLPLQWFLTQKLTLLWLLIKYRGTRNWRHQYRLALVAGQCEYTLILIWK